VNINVYSDRVLVCRLTDNKQELYDVSLAAEASSIPKGAQVHANIAQNRWSQHAADYDEEAKSVSVCAELQIASS
jgi:hypothetical protein